MHLTQQSLSLAGLAGLAEIAGLWSERPELCWLAAIVLAALLLGLLAEFFGRSARVPGIRLTVAPISLGEEGSVEVEVGNATAAPLHLEYLPEFAAAARGSLVARSVTVPAHGLAADRYPLRPLRLGRHALPALRTRILGRFALAWWPRVIDAPATVAVRPAFLSSDERRRATTHGAGAPLLMAGSGTELLQLRPYRSGDPPRSIDWRATARAGELISREFGRDQHLEILLAVDAGRHSRLGIDGNDRLGHYAHVAARFAERAVIAEDRVGLMVFADRVLVQMAPARGVAAVRAVRDALAGVEAVEAESDLVSAALAIRKLTRVRSLIVLFTDVDDPRGSGQLSQAVALLRPLHQPLVAGLRSAAIGGLARVRPVRRAQAYAGLAADEYEDAQADTVARLRLLGVPAVLALPDGYERAVLATYDSLRSRQRV